MGDPRFFTPEALTTFAGGYPVQPMKLTHGLLAHPLLDLPALQQLARELPSDSIEYNPGNLPVGIAPEDVPTPERALEQALEGLESAGVWVVLKRIEQVAAYRELMESILGDLAHVVQPRTGAMLRQEGFIFISSPGAVTPFHFDPEHNILLQVRGSKTMTVFPGDDEAIFAPHVHEAFHLGQHHRNLPWQEDFARKGVAITIRPGEAIHVPVKAPHWVQNGDGVSVSLSVTWRSEWSFAEADARAFNHVLRGVGLTPRSPAPYPASNRVKALANRALRRLRG